LSVNRHNNRIEEVELRPAEGAPAIDEGSEGISYVFRRHELVLDDHPCVREHPHLFVDPPTDVLKKQLSEYTA